MQVKDKSTNHLQQLFIKSQILSFSLTIFTVLIGYFLLEPVVKIVLPDYASGVLPCKVMMIAAIPYSLIENANKLLLSLECKRLYTWYYLISITIFGITLLALLAQDMISSYYISLSMLLSFTVFAILSNYKSITLLMNKVS